MRRRVQVVALLSALGLSAGLCATAVAESPPVNDQVCAAVDAPADAARCQQAISSETDAERRATLLFRRAYAHNERERYEAALADLNAALKLAPRYAPALGERGYTLNALGRYREAEEDLNAQGALTPNEPRVYQERAYARFYQANLTGALADWNRAVALAPGEIDVYQGRGKLHMWLGRFDAAGRDFDTALRLALDQRNSRLERSAREWKDALALWSRASDGDPARTCTPERVTEQPLPQHVIGDCTALFLGANTNAERASALTTRSIAWGLTGHEHDRVTDLQLAVAFEPDNWQWRANLGGGYLSVRHSWAARIEFDRSLALHSEGNFVAYAGRAQAAYNLGDMEAAFRDARASFDIQPNALALTVLGDVAFNHFHDAKSAREFWLNAYRLGSRDDGLMERLRSIGVADPEQAVHEPQ